MFIDKFLFFSQFSLGYVHGVVNWAQACTFWWQYCLDLLICYLIKRYSHWSFYNWLLSFYFCAGFFHRSRVRMDGEKIEIFWKNMEYFCKGQYNELNFMLFISFMRKQWKNKWLLKDFHQKLYLVWADINFISCYVLGIYSSVRRRP